jgi:hypothetical protein
MTEALAAYEKLAAKLGGESGIALGHMFGKACIKIDGKAFLALHL